jgi:hypothetical protein
LGGEGAGGKMNGGLKGSGVGLGNCGRGGTVGRPVSCSGGWPPGLAAYKWC